MKHLLAILGLVLWATALWLAPPKASTATTVVTNAVRPAMLPFLWRSLREAERTGSATEAFAAARALMALLPQWTDGHLVFAWRFVLGGDQVLGADAAQRAAARLQTALAFLAEARGQQPAREVDLLIGTSFLIELAAQHHPGIGAFLGDGVAAEPAVLADRYLEQAEKTTGAGRSVREARIFKVPGLLVGLLRHGERDRAIEVLDAVLPRIAQVQDPELRAEWEVLMRKVRARLMGGAVDLDELAVDPRLETLVPLLR